MKITTDTIMNDAKCKEALYREIKANYEHTILPYWKNLIDETYGGYYGFVDYDLQVIKNAEKGVILNSRILWFFSKAYFVTKDSALWSYAQHAYHFLKDRCYDNQNGGVYWMMNYDGTVKNDMKHTYNQAFAIYGLTAYYEAFKEEDARKLALQLFDVIEQKCRDDYGYREAFLADWNITSNEELSENGLLAEKTMNTLLHILEAYTELYRISLDERVKCAITEILHIFENKVYNSKMKRLEVFFDSKMNSIADLHSYGHDIEASWLLDRAYETISEGGGGPLAYTQILADTVRRVALEQGTVNNECFQGKVDKTRVWWVQAEAIVGFYNAYEKTKDSGYLDTVHQIWEYIKEKFVDGRIGGEWFWDLNVDGIAQSKKPITEPWKCPYHNGRMCFELMRRLNPQGNEVCVRL